ncbi:MAG: response regulator [Burkholderiales bacterium]|nr:response regulator [Burkholderiales bacterium]
MSEKPRILAVDDNAQNVRLLEQLLKSSGYEVVSALSGADALAKLEAAQPDLVLLDVVMPGMSGYEVCRAIRANPATALLPVVMVTALDPAEERVKGIEAGADDFLSKPINQAEILARVKSLLRIRALHRKVEDQARQLTEWNAKLEERVAAQVAQLDRLARLKRFLSPKVADLIVEGKLDDPLLTHRKEVVVAFADLRGFTSFTETADPEEVFAVLHAYHGELGRLIAKHDGTVEHFAGDGVMIIFNDPAPVPNPALNAVLMALDVRDAVERLSGEWRKRGYKLECGLGIAQGFATIGTIGFEGRFDYGTIGTVTNLAARLCGEAKPGQILISQRAFGNVEPYVDAEAAGELVLKGFSKPMPAFSVSGRRNVAKEVA